MKSILWNRSIKEILWVLVGVFLLVGGIGAQSQSPQANDKAVAEIHASKAVHPAPLLPGDWRDVPADERARVLGELKMHATDYADTINKLTTLRALELPFYAEAVLYEGEVERAPGQYGVFAFIHHQRGFTVLTSKSEPIHALNASAPIRLDTAQQAEAYLRFFCAAVQSNDSTFRIVERPDDLHWSADAPQAMRRAAESALQPLAIRKADGNVWRAEGIILYGNTLFAPSFAVKPDGKVEMITDYAKRSDLVVQTMRFIGVLRFEELPETLAKWVETAKEERRPWQEALEINEKGMDLYRKGQYREAEDYLRRALEIIEKEKESDPDHPDVAQSLNNLAMLYQAQSQYAKAEPLLQRALAIREKALGPDHPAVADSLNNLALLYFTQGRYAQAESLCQRTLAIWEKALGPDHPDTAASLNNLAAFYDAQGQYAQAEPLYQRALAIREKALGPDHPDVAGSLNNLAMHYQAQGQYAQAEPLLQRALAIHEKALGPDHLLVATSLNNLAMHYKDQGQYAQPESLYQRALAIREKVLGFEHPDVAISLNNLAAFYDAQGQYAQAEPLFRRAVAILQKTDTPANLLLFNRNLGSFLTQQGQLQDALPYYRTAADTLDRLFNQTRGLSEEARLTFLGQYAHVYREFLDLLLRLHEQDAKAGFDREFLAVASRNQSRLFSELLRQGDVNRLAGDPAFAALKAQRQTLLGQLAGLREKHATLLPTAPDYAGQKAELEQRLAALTAELTGVDERLWRDYPRFIELLTLPRPVTVEQLQAELLRPGDVLLSVVLLPERAVVMAVSRDRFIVQVSPLTAAEIGQRVAAIRAGLTPPSQGDPLAALERLDPTDLYTLYHGLIAPVEPALKDAQRVLVVADGPLYSLPLELLITDYDATRQSAFRAARSKATGRPNRPALLSEYAELPYLADRYTFRYLPSLAALASQRRYPKPTAPATRPLVAFADPVFDPQDAAAVVSTRGYTPATQQTLALLTRSGARTGSLARLPDTAEEARALAAIVPGDARLYLRQDAQERTVKDLSRAGDLKGLRYLLFATHGLLGGEFRLPEPPPDPKALLDPARRTAPTEKLGQPALALTLAPALPNEDGFLTLKDVIEDLDLDTDLVILSACNTAGDSAKTTTGEGFAGLTRAFLFAGARHLWVSHWPVESAAARDLTTDAVRAREAGQPDPAAALAAAQTRVRHSVVPFTLQGDPRQLARAHPFFWAPFVTVGD